jgi:hypothetical protein
MQNYHTMRFFLGFFLNLLGVTIARKITVKTMKNFDPILEPFWSKSWLRTFQMTHWNLFDVDWSENSLTLNSKTWNLFLYKTFITLLLNCRSMFYSLSEALRWKWVRRGGLSETNAGKIFGMDFFLISRVWNYLWILIKKLMAGILPLRRFLGWWSHNLMT